MEEAPLMSQVAHVADATPLGSLSHRAGAMGLNLAPKGTMTRGNDHSTGNWMDIAWIDGRGSIGVTL